MTDTRTESRDLAHHRPAAAPAPAQDGSADRFAQTIQMVREAMLNPEVDAEKAKAMADLMISLEDRSLQAEFNRAKNAAVQEMPVITKDGRIVIKKQGEPERQQGRFARFEDIDRVVRPILQRHNLAITFDIAERQGGGLTVTPILTHANGFTERGGGFPVPAETSGSKNAAQAMGSSSSYGKRYAYCACLNIVTEGVDDDGNMGVLTTLPYEREQLVKAEAALASEQGCYQAWFDRQPPKDRAYLVSSGLHEQLGGKALPAPPAKPKPAPKGRKDADPAPDSRQPTGQGEPTGEKRKAQTPREWADLVKDELPKCLDRDALDIFWDGKRPLLDRLKGTDEKLWQELDDAYRLRGEQIDEGKLL
jgi:hypothetical protein